MSQKHKLKIRIILTVVLTCAIGFMQQHQVFAGGWIGNGAQSGGIPASGGGGGGGAIANYGHSWIYYQYTGGGHDEVTFTPTGETFGYAGLPISSECAEEGSGFWHHGYNVNPSESAPDWDAYIMVDSGKWGHYTSMPYGLVGADWFWAGDYITHGNDELGHNIGGMYQASYYGSEEDVFNDFKTAYSFINGTAYDGGWFPDDLYAFCFSDNMKSRPTTFQGHTTASIGRGDDKVVVKSGWDGFNSGQYTSDQDSNQFTISFTHKIKRTDQIESASEVKWKLATTNNDGLSNLIGSNDDRTMQFSAEERNGTKKVAETTSYTVEVAPGKTKTFCQGINHDITVLVSPEGSVLEGQNPSRSEAKACITISHIGSGKENHSSATTKPSYIGEQSTIEKTGAHTIYFYVNKSTAQPSDDQVQNSDTKQYYGEGDKNSPGSDDDADYNNAICSQYNTFCRNNNYKDANTDSTPIDDDENLVGAKICAASSSRNSEFNDKWGTRSKTISRLNNEGNTITETVTESYQIFDYYWTFSNLSCSPIYKKPNTQVTNGSVFSAEKITSTVSSKITGPVSGKTFGSWSEYLAIAGDSIKNFGSGAALRNGSDTNTLQANSPLSIANNKANDIGHSKITQLPTTFFTNLKNYILSTSKLHPSDKIKVYDNAGQTVDVSNFDLPANRINIIYAKNINIPSNVTSVNAWLIADGGTINTCSGYRIGADEDDLVGISATKCNSSLTINGAVYAKKYKLYRTHGAGSGDNSATPAETFNLTANDYRYAFEAVSGNRIQPNEVYTRELAPRM